VVKVERRAVIGAGRLKQALRGSEDSKKLNTSFVERLNLTIRLGSAELVRIDASLPVVLTSVEKVELTPKKPDARDSRFSA
jgi:hypothetical protein